ncbi:MAG: D-alanine--D-alanine ligase [Proteobacteria bacterium]|nr:D-alanine--D-alanine ligase [Pseudomonadota bacterium]
MRRRVVVLMGGFSAEREVSLVSGAEVADALDRAGYEAARVDVTRDLGALLAALAPRPDAVFNALHGRFGEDGCMQGVLEMLAVPYTHSGVLASALAMDKPAAKRLFRDAGIPVAEHKVVTRREAAAGDVMARPYVVKPLNEGSSVGVRIVRAGDNAPALDAAAAEEADAPVMVEEFIPGRELTVAVMGDRPLAVTEIRTGRGFYDYRAKYEPGGSQHLLPAPLPAAVYAAALDLGLGAHRTLGCRGVTRTDLRYDDTRGAPGRLVVLEVNTQPGMTPTSLVPEQAAHAGIDFARLCAWMVEEARCDG